MAPRPAVPLHLLHVPEPALDHLGLRGLGQRVGGEAPEDEPAVLEVTAAHRAPGFEVHEALERLRAAPLVLAPDERQDRSGRG